MTLPATSTSLPVAMILGLTLTLGTAAEGADEASSSPQLEAWQILDDTGTRGGLVVHLGCGDGTLTAALRAGDGYLVHGLDADAANVRQAREHCRSLGLYGPVSVERWTGNRLPYTDNLVNLVVAEALGEIPMAEVLRVLVPEGVAYVRQNGRWTKTVKPRPEEIDEWTHFLHGPDNNAVARDRVVGPPHHLQWVGGPKWARSHDHLSSVSAMVSTAGRIFYVVDEGPTAAVALPPKWFLVARDAFNGVILWKRPIGSWEGHLRGFRTGPAALARRLVAVGDRVYVTLGYGKPASMLDAATGQTLKTYERTENTLEIVCHQGMLFLVVGEPPEPGSPTPGAPIEKRPDWLFWRQYTTTAPKKRLLAIDARSGDLAWEKSGADTAELMPTTLAAGGDRVFFQNTKEVLCLDAKSGDELWRAARPVSVRRPTWSAPTLVVYGDVVLSADRATGAPAEEGAPEPERVEWLVSALGGSAPLGHLIAFSAKTGERLWGAECRECYNAPVDVLVAAGLVWTGSLVHSRDPGITVARDPLTGEIKTRRPPDATFFPVGMAHHRCYRNKATDRYLVLGRAGIELIDTATGKGIPSHWVRGACQYGVVPCNGLLYAPSHSCACFIEAKLNGFNALAPKRGPESPGPESPGANRAESRLQRGPAFEKVATAGSPGTSAPDPWPTFRHDASRSGSTRSPVPAELQPAWQTELGGKLSSPVLADGKVFTAAVDDHTVHALDAQDGKSLWSYTAGGRVDSPPTIHQGLAVFGSADGWVYCLRAADGELVWRFRAAPEERRVTAYGQLESAWPVSGSVLVRDGSVYFAAGRSSYLDGGIRLYGLDLKTGKLLSTACMDDRDPATGQEPNRVVRGLAMLGSLPDVLASDGPSIYMRHRRFDEDLQEQTPDVPHLFSPAGFLDDAWWHRTYWIIGTRMASGWGAWPNAGNQVPAGRLLVSDGPTVYGFGRTPYHRNGSHVGLGETHYRLFAADRKPQPRKPAGGQTKPGSRKAPAPPVRYHWTQKVPVLVRAMLLADRTLFMAGPPDPFGSKDPVATLEGRNGGQLLAVSAADGGKLAQYPLDAPPVFDGMAAAGGRLYLATTDGKVLSFH